MADNLERMPYGESGNTLLRGQSSQILKLRNASRLRFSWAPDNLCAMNVEVRMRIVDWAYNPSLYAHSPPLVRYSYELGHGRAVWRKPPAPMDFSKSGMQPVDEALPARGLVHRMQARELAVNLVQLDTWNQGEPLWEWVSVQVSFQPAIGGGDVQCVPGQQYHRPSAVDRIQPMFPAEAREFRVHDGQGAAAPGAFFFIDLKNVAFPIAGVSAATFLNWTPIPLKASGWGSGSDANPMHIEYR